MQFFYSGVFGPENFPDWAQKDEEGNPLTYGKYPMMCPSSPYIDEVLLPQIKETLEYAKYDAIFFDMPWIMKGGCYCENCEHRGNERVVRDALEDLTSKIRNIDVGVNASAPYVNENSESGGHISNLRCLFTQYITEWNPYRWNQTAKVVRRAIKEAKLITEGDFYHATTCTDKEGTILPENKLRGLFQAVRESGANLRLGIGFNDKGLKQIKNALP